MENSSSSDDDGKQPPSKTIFLPAGESVGDDVVVVGAIAEGIDAVDKVRRGGTDDDPPSSKSTLLLSSRSSSEHTDGPLVSVVVAPWWLLCLSSDADSKPVPTDSSGLSPNSGVFPVDASCCGRGGRYGGESISYSSGR